MNECIIVTSPEVKKPVALRYCFRNFQLGNMANAGGLPTLPIPYRRLVINNIAVDLCVIQRPQP